MPPWAGFPARSVSWLRDAPVLFGVLAIFYGVLAYARHGAGAAGAPPEISLSASALPGYALFSLIRITVAYGLSLAFTLAYGYIAAYHRRAERIMVPLLDTLQSIPVLSFLPPVMIAMVSLLPNRQAGIELGSILLIFTGQVWNMTFSFYSSLKSVPQEMREAAQVYGFSWWQRFAQMELPYAAIGLIWNSMMSVAGGWFFLMACEMFVLGDRDFRLPGLGSYLQTAANAGNARAILLGVLAMIAVIVMLDQVVWRPVIAWAEKFKFEQVEAVNAPRSPVLAWLRRSRLLQFGSRWTVKPSLEYLNLRLAGAGQELQRDDLRRRGALWVYRGLAAATLLAIACAIIKMGSRLAGLSGSELRQIFIGGGATFLRVEFVLLLATLWTVPAGVFIGLRPRVSAMLQPLAQIAASVPATALFPVMLLVLIRWGGGLGMGSLALLLLGTQWYLLFNIIAGASAIPADLKEVCALFGFRSLERWRLLLLPAIFPYLITGLVTASGGAWNASIVAEYFHFKGQTFSTVGLGAVISAATDAGNFRLLLAATVLMAAIVVSINRLLWRRLYVLAATRFKLEG